MKSKSRVYLAWFAVLIVLLCTVIMVFFDDALGLYLHSFNAITVEYYLRNGMLAGAILVCVLWVSLYFIIVKRHRMVRSEKKLQQEQALNQYIMTLNQAMSALGCCTSEAQALEAVRCLEAALLIHFSENDLNLELKRQLPSLDILIKTLLGHIKFILRYPEFCGRSDVHYALRLLTSSSSKTAAYCRQHRLIPASFERLHIDGSLLRGFLMFGDMIFTDCVFYGITTFDEVILQGRLHFRHCIFKDSVYMKLREKGLYSFESCFFEGDVQFINYTEDNPVECVSLASCTFSQTADFRTIRAYKIDISDSVFEQDMLLCNATVDALLMVRVSVSGTIHLDSMQLQSIFSLNHVKCADALDMTRCNFNRTCRIQIQNTQIADENMMWFALGSV